ncbi:hypothetical protein [Colidextribacter sp. OB.20]|uniref:hypothetical protein n=1 Tax=Colidextribacter sp. OB.20 TaxID=2304568 RepID=UPI001367E685|nr:hypothetical protein [Colidextribacter sp. OB.20]
MGRREVYCIGERQQIYFTRWELEGQPVEVEETQRTTLYRHKDYPTRCVRWTGLHLTKYGDLPEQQSMGSLVSDAGPKCGVSVVTERAPEVPYTSEERAAGRERIRQAVEKIYGCRCEWKNKGGAPDVGEDEESVTQVV